MSTEVLQKLLDDYVMGTISPEDKQRLLSLMGNPVSSQEVEALLLKDLASGRYDADDIPEVRERLQERLDQLIGSPRKRGAVHRVHFLKTAWFRYAAAIVIVAGLGAYFWLAQKGFPPFGGNDKGGVKNVVAGREGVVDSNSNKAVLTLADGSKLILDNTANGTLAQQGNAQVIKLDDGRLAYQLKGVAGKEAMGVAGKEIMWNTMTTPRGGQYQLTLPDGTKVWLNAASSITYPVAFTGGERKVSVTGEAYFEVAKNKSQIFKVKVNNLEDIVVIGTSFNVNAYQGDRLFKASLLEGAVKVNNQVLTPGQAYINGKIVTTDLEQDIAWKNGLFNFNHLSLPEVMNQIARWYDVDIEYEGELPPFDFYGEMWRDISLPQVLKGLSTGLGIHFKLEGKRLIVSH